MARVEVVRYVCDLTGKDIPDGEHEELTFMVDGKTYALDTDKKGAEKFRKAVKPYTEAARVVKAPRRPRKSGRAERTRKIREWALSQGIGVADRGRIPATIVEQYENAHK